MPSPAKTDCVGLQPDLRRAGHAHPGGQLARNGNRALVAERLQHVDHGLLHGRLPAT